MPHRTGLLNPKSKEYTWHTTYTNTIKGLRAISYLRYSVCTQEWRVSRDRRRPAAGRWCLVLVVAASTRRTGAQGTADRRWQHDAQSRRVACRSGEEGNRGRAGEGQNVVADAEAD